jgi:hypothetical protein
MILSMADFPSTTDQTLLTSAIALAESLAQGSDGANRLLEITNYIEVFEVNRNSFFLSYFPIVNPESIEVYHRGQVSELWGIEGAIAFWQLVPSSQYFLDEDTGELVITNLPGGMGQFYSQAPRNPFRSMLRRQIKVKYQAGYDFDSESPIVQSIKSSLILLAEQIQSPAIAQGIKSFEIDDEGHKTTYASSTDNAIMGSASNRSASGLIMRSFHKYRPRSYSFA